MDSTGKRMKMNGQGQTTKKTARTEARRTSKSGQTLTPLNWLVLQEQADSLSPAVDDENNDVNNMFSYTIFLFKTKVLNETVSGQISNI